MCVWVHCTLPRWRPRPCPGRRRRRSETSGPSRSCQAMPFPSGIMIWNKWNFTTHLHELVALIAEAIRTGVGFQADGWECAAVWSLSGCCFWHISWYIKAFLSPGLICKCVGLVQAPPPEPKMPPKKAVEPKAVPAAAPEATDWWAFICSTSALWQCSLVIAWHEMVVRWRRPRMACIHGTKSARAMGARAMHLGSIHRFAWFGMVCCTMLLGVHCAFSISEEPWPAAASGRQRARTRGGARVRARETHRELRDMEQEVSQLHFSFECSQLHCQHCLGWYHVLVDWFRLR